MELIRPMLATLGTVSPERSGEYAFEIKWDGVRLVTYTEGRSVRAFTRNDRDVSATYPEITALADALGGRRCVLDGEIVAFNAEGVVHFGTLQERMHVTDPRVVQRLTAKVPLVYAVFDVLSLDGATLINRPYEQRRELLDELELSTPRIQAPPAIDGNAEHALAVSKEMRAEGIVAKRLGSHYAPGRRSLEWIKTKHERMQEVIIGGWRPGAGNRHGRIGSLLLGVPSPQGLRYAGRVGTGFTYAVLDQIAKKLEPLATDVSPFTPQPPRDVVRDANWVTPQLVGEVRYGEWTGEGILRHPVWRGLRPDKQPDQITLE